MHRFTIAATLFATLSVHAAAGEFFAYDTGFLGGVTVASGDVDNDLVPEHMMMEVYTVDENAPRDADGPDPILMVISNQDFWYVVDTYEFVDEMGNDLVFSKKSDKKAQEEYLVIKLKPVYISSYSLSGSVGGG